ncbi:MAG: N-acetylmuramoyl-L-alanine amidase [Marmoricola sp.]
MIRDRLVVLAAGAVASVVLVVPLVGITPLGQGERGPQRAAPAALSTTAKPLAGLRIALDPGHQLGNHNFPRQVDRQVQAGGFTKPCNTTGTATNGGYPEATLNFRVANLVKARLEALGARVFLTRTRNSESLWGPCVNVRGEFGKKVGAVLEVSLHGDGAPARDHGFHVIAPTRRSPWTTDIATASLRLAEALRSGLDARHVPRSTYVGGGTALNIRSDLGTLNMSDVPVAMIEVGNMRNRSDARRMTTVEGRRTYASAVVLGIRTYLRR